MASTKPATRRSSLVTPGRARMLLEAIETGSEDREACEYAGVTAGGLRKHRRDNPDFEEAYQAARAERGAVYRATARRRAVEGWLEPVWYKGRQVGTVRRFSDRMLELLLKAELPEEFGDRQVVEVLHGGFTGADIAAAVRMGQIAAEAGQVDVLEAAAALMADNAAVIEGEVVE